MNIEEMLEEVDKRPMYYRMDGTPYPPGEAGMLEWAADMNKPRHVGMTRLANGRHISTVWLGLDHNYWPKGAPVIFESAYVGDKYESYGTILGRRVFTQIDVLDRYCTKDDALAGHNAIVDRYNLRWQLWTLGVMAGLYVLVSLC
jgi:hypothetical protein